MNTTRAIDADLSAAASVEARRAKAETRYQLERLGFFTIDPNSGQSPTTGHRLAPIRAGSSIFNRTITLKDTWAKIERKQI